MERELKEGDRLIDTDGDKGTARGIVKGEDGEYRFAMVYDKGFTVNGMVFTPIKGPAPALGFEHCHD